MGIKYKFRMNAKSSRADGWTDGLINVTLPWCGLAEFHGAR